MKKTLFFILSIFILAGISAPAFALDGYKSRSGFYLQLGGTVGGGAMTLKTDDSTVSSKRQVDGGVNVGFGFGLGETFVLGGEALWMGQGKQLGNDSYFIHNVDVLGGLDVFLFSGFVIGAQGGLAYLYETDSKAGETKIVGWGVKGSAGYEGFVSGNLAVGGRFFYLRNFYSDRDYDTFGAALTIRWY